MDIKNLPFNELSERCESFHKLIETEGKELQEKFYRYISERDVESPLSFHDIVSSLNVTNEGSFSQKISDLFKGSIYEDFIQENFVHFFLFIERVNNYRNCMEELEERMRVMTMEVDEVYFS